MRVELDMRGGETLGLTGDGEWTIGRAENADICIGNDPYCSRMAGSIRVEAGAVSVAPASDQVEIFLNGAQLPPGYTPVPHGAVLELGQQYITIRILGTAPAPHYTQPPSSQHTGDETLIPVQGQFTIGRTESPGGIAIDHPAISRRHAEITVRGNDVSVHDLGSTNGTYINGEEVRGRHPLYPGDTISFGPKVYRFDGHVLELLQDDGEEALVLSGLAIDVPNRDGSGMLRILNDVSLTINRGEFVCIVGSSGSGKSTLMGAMAARSVPTEGFVLMNGLDLQSNFAALKHDVAFVPQNDVLHEQLSLRRALDYSAQLRLPPDLSGRERQTLIETAAQAVDLHERLDMQIQHLSGGQKKRASLANETLADPSVLFLDEVTSGLDEATDRDIMSLLSQRAADGTTIVCVTHTLANVMKYCDRLIVMGRGGYLTFNGPPADALGFFGIDRLGDLFDRLDEHGPEYWNDIYLANAPETSATPAAQTPSTVGAPANARPSLLRQFAILTRRNARLMLADRKNLMMALIQSLMIGALVGYAYSDLGSGPQIVSSKISLLMLLAMASLWLGCNTSSTNIVGEALIFQRERDVGVSTISFVLAKFAVSGCMAIFQVLIVYALTQMFAENVPGEMGAQFAIIALGALVGVALGLFISAASGTQEQANTIVPLALIPQLVLAGVLVPALPELGTRFSEIAVTAFWLTEGLKENFIMADGPVEQLDLETGQIGELEAKSIATSYIALGSHLAVFLTAAVVTAIRRFSHS